MYSTDQSRSTGVELGHSYRGDRAEVLRGSAQVAQVGPAPTGPTRGRSPPGHHTSELGRESGVARADSAAGRGRGHDERFGVELPLGKQLAVRIEGRLGPPLLLEVQHPSARGDCGAGRPVAGEPGIERVDSVDYGVALRDERLTVHAHMPRVDTDVGAADR